MLAALMGDGPFKNIDLCHCTSAVVKLLIVVYFSRITIHIILPKQLATIVTLCYSYMIAASGLWSMHEWLSSDRAQGHSLSGLSTVSVYSTSTANIHQQNLL